MRNFLYHARGEAFDVSCESLGMMSFILSEGFKQEWSLPGGEPLLLELIPVVFLHIYRVLCVHKLKPSLSKTAIGHAYAFNPASATLLAPGPLEQAMLEKDLPLKSKVIQVQAEPSSHWPALFPSTIVECISMLRVWLPLSFL